nr:reverse transcriptase domain-containing protein [Tanacetum cinerariifolium]
MNIKTKLETTTKNHQASIQNLEAKFDRFADKQSGRPSGFLPSDTQPNSKDSSSKPYQPQQDRNEHINVVFTRSGKTYDLPINPNDQPNDSETPINFDSDDEDDEPTPQPKPKEPKLVKETPIPKPYKPKIPYPQRLRKEKMEAQYGKFLDMIRAVQINVPLFDVLAGMPNYGKFLKELVSNKHKIEQISTAFLSDESSVILQNKFPPKLGDPGSFLIPCNFNKAFSCNALADLGASINLMPYSLCAKLSLETLKPTKLNQLNLRVGTERMIFHIDSTMKHSYSNDDTCFSIDVIDEILEKDFDALLDEVVKSSIPLKEPSSKKNSLYFQIPIDPMDQEKTTFTCPFGIYAYRRMPFGLCNAPATFQRCMLAIFHDMIEESVKVFMDDIFVFGNSFDNRLNNLDKILQRCKDAHLVLNWEKCHFMVKEGIVLGHKVSEAGLTVNKA